MRSFFRNFSLLFFAGAGLLLVSCDIPVSFGPKINTEVPVIKGDPDKGNQPGSYLYGAENNVFLNVIQEFGINLVYMTLWYTDLNGNQQQKTVEANKDPATGNYAVNIDTTGMADGPIRGQVTAIDTSGKSTTTTDIIYIVKNLPPQVEMTLPAIKGGTMANPGYPVAQIPDFDDPDLNTILTGDYPVSLGMDLFGMAEDNMGIALGYPKIMLWPAGDPTVPVDGDGLPTDARYGTWRSMVTPIVQDGLKATKISWPMVNLIADSSAEGGYRLPKQGEPMSYLPPKNYRFRIMTKDMYGKVNYYPNRSDNRRGPGGTAADPAVLSPKYMEISYIAVEIPIVTIRSIPQYYNGVGNFTVDFIVSSQNDLTAVEAFVTNTEDGAPGYISPSYNLTTGHIALQSTIGTSRTYKLTITAADAVSWPVPADGNLFLNLRATDFYSKSSPPAFRNFINDTIPPEVMFDRPVVVTTPKASGTLTGGSYSIYNPTSPPRWVTGQITIGGLSKDSFGISKVYYHIGKLSDDNATETERKTIYENPANWTDTKLDTTTPEANWSGTVYAWSYSENFNGWKTSPALKLQIQEETDIG
ncbi:MAG: hypothetical protein FWC45_00830, partial [Treponema sp.]|nr:hypothetical protein [Treponema sp.]